MVMKSRRKIITIKSLDLETSKRAVLGQEGCQRLLMTVGLLDHITIIQKLCEQVLSSVEICALILFVLRMEKET